MVTLATMALLIEFYSGGCHYDNLWVLQSPNSCQPITPELKIALCHILLNKKKMYLLGKFCWGPHWTILWFLIYHTIPFCRKGNLYGKKISRFSKGCCSKVVSQRSGRAERSWRLNSPPLDRLQNWPRKNFDQSAISRSSLQDRTNGR